ncbi:response regulator [Alishewanella sp. BS5-314]|uniref:response regulator n=1 Tax=Alishewanella sp. BS5-314 TaxID=2755587 RepID=UPI0021BB0D6A|nr:response regulator [Alishewanella sp. BS5-314]MCT8124975.1 response regulator [Alishewanella sp. BS5-314]
MLLKNFNVLVLDDVVLMCDFLYGVANKVPGCKAFKALDAKTASEILEHETIDLLITDIELRGTSGLDLLSRVRAGVFSATAHDIPIIVFSGNAYRELIQQCILFDVNDFLAKPLSAEQLTRKIQHHLAHEKLILPAAHYQEMKARLEAPKATDDEVGQQRLRVAIVRELEQKAEQQQQELDDSRPEVERRDFLYWPEDATSGYFQLDRRLRNLAYNLSCFHNVFINNCRTVAIDAERKRACAAADYLIHIAKTMQQREQRPEFWAMLQQRLQKLQPLIAELAEVNVKHHKQVLALLKKLAYWWMQTCNRPLINRTETEDESSLH